MSFCVGLITHGMLILFLMDSTSSSLCQKRVKGRKSEQPDSCKVWKKYIF